MTLPEFRDEESLHRFQSSRESTELHDYLQRLWPNCLESSTSTRLLLPPPRRNGSQLNGWPHTEIRTIYFRAAMTAEQRAKLAKVRTNQACANITPLPDTQPGPTTWAWMPGFRMRKGKLAVAAVFLLRWRSGELRESFDEEFGLWCGDGDGEEYLYQPQVFERELEAAGRIDQEVIYCDFESGPWCV